MRSSGIGKNSFKFPLQAQMPHPIKCLQKKVEKGTVLFSLKREDDDIYYTVTDVLWNEECKIQIDIELRYFENRE